MKIGRSTLNFAVRVGIAVIVVGFLPTVARTDWIHGYFAPNAGTDSIDRFMVIRDYRDSTLLGRTILRAGDLNSDGIDDIVACRVGYSNIIDDTAFSFLGGRPPSGIFHQRFTNFNNTISNIGDINRDGYDDFGRDRFRTAPQRFEVSLGGPLLSDSVWAYFPSVPWFTKGARVADLDGDGNLELALITHIDSNSVKIFQVTPTVDTIPKYVIRDTSQNFGDNLVVGDFNGDGHPDLAVAAAWNRYVDPPFVKFYWGGPAFDTIADFVIANPSPKFGYILLSCGDLNGDGYDDIVICGGGNDPCGIYFGGPSMDNRLDVTLSWQGPGFYLPPTSVSSGDFNHDGKQDIVLSYQDLSFSSSYFELFLGGPAMDSLAEVHIYGADIGGPLWDMGRNIFGIGDFNGDGVDDIAMPTLSDNGCCWWAEINLLAGWNSNPTEVPGENHIVPSTFSLEQNYPNPFNATTQISFSVPKRARVKVTVTDMLGRVRGTLVDRVLDAGTYKATWDAERFASGTYICVLEAGDVKLSRKMVLVK